MPQKYPIFNKDFKHKLQKKGNNYFAFALSSNVKSVNL